MRLPFLGPRCEGCPPNFCDDDPAVVQGYCCGCARFFGKSFAPPNTHKIILSPFSDVLPVTCGAFLHCPLNSYDLCEDYEYMMHCCCWLHFLWTCDTTSAIKSYFPCWQLFQSDVLRCFVLFFNCSKTRSRYSPLYAKHVNPINFPCNSPAPVYAEVPHWIRVNSCAISNFSVPTSTFAFRDLNSRISYSFFAGQSKPQSRNLATVS